MRQRSHASANSPLLIVAGVPQGLMVRYKGYELKLDGWNVRVLPSRTSSSANLKSCWADVIRMAHDADLDGAHILAYHPRQSDRPFFQRDIGTRHRLGWLDKDVINTYGTDTFGEIIERLSNFEQKWRKALRPRGVNSPLMLPESSFVPITCGEMWKRVRRISVGHDDMTKVQRLVEEFRRRHYRRGVWCDLNQRQFVSQETHAGAHLDREWRWKFTVLLPPGFHFNVSCTDRRRYVVVRDCKGNVHHHPRYLNVDQHGFVRGIGRIDS